MDLVKVTLHDASATWPHKGTAHRFPVEPLKLSNVAAVSVFQLKTESKIFFFLSLKHIQKEVLKSLKAVKADIQMRYTCCRVIYNGSTGRFLISFICFSLTCRYLSKHTTCHPLQADTAVCSRNNAKTCW